MVHLCVPTLKIPAGAYPKTNPVIAIKLVLSNFRSLFEQSLEDGGIGCGVLCDTHFLSATTMYLLVQCKLHTTM